jgi:uncharacterized protein YcgL (UPF0745 family)
MKCNIFKSPKNLDTYLYVREDEAFEDLPQALQDLFVNPQLVMTLELTPQRKLARENPEDVIRNLQSQGYHIQFPPEPDRQQTLQ